MRVLLFTTEYPPATDLGGLGSFVHGAASALVEAGAEVHVLCCRADVTDCDRIGDVGEHLHLRSIPRHESVLLGRLGLSPSAAFAREARRLGPFDVIEAPDWEAAGFVATLRPTAPLVVCLHTPTVLVRRYGSRAGNRLREWLERAAARRADAVVTYSPLLADELAAIGWFRASDVVLGPPCLERELLERRVVALPAEPMVLGVGRLEPRKGFDLLVGAAALLRDDVVGLRLVIVGRDVVDSDGRRGSDRLRRLADRLDVPLELVPPVPKSELGPWYAQARAVAVTSRFDSYSMVGLEALSHGRPVVCTPRVGFGVAAASLGVAGPGRAVRQCDAEPRAVADALRPLLTDDAEATTAAAAAPPLARRMADPKEFAERRLDLYRAVASGRSACVRPTGPGRS